MTVILMFTLESKTEAYTEWNRMKWNKMTEYTHVTLTLSSYGLSAYRLKQVSNSGLNVVVEKTISTFKVLNFYSLTLHRIDLILCMNVLVMFTVFEWFQPLVKNSNLHVLQMCIACVSLSSIHFSLSLSIYYQMIVLIFLSMF